MPRARDEVVEHVLLHEQPTSAVPILAILTAAAQIRHHQDTTLLQPQELGRVEPRFERNAETAVPGEQCRGGAVALDARSGHKRHRHPGAIRGSRELTANL